MNKYLTLLTRVLTLKFYVPVRIIAVPTLNSPSTLNGQPAFYDYWILTVRPWFGLSNRELIMKSHVPASLWYLESKEVTALEPVNRLLTFHFIKYCNADYLRKLEVTNIMNELALLRKELDKEEEIQYYKQKYTEADKAGAQNVVVFPKLNTFTEPSQPILKEVPKEEEPKID